ncbi:MAG: SpoVA/SpoVAEb family sporulation membrane protein [Clostridia bacterium]|nr:SpoVA/SpoVAEb family sporulation membrane protein [Clostridia bacterium]
MTEALLMYLKVLVVGGTICMIGEIIIIETKITPARILVLFLMVGAVLGGLNIYQYLVEWAGAGATIPITGFGAALARGAIIGAKTHGFFGALGGGLIATSAGIAVSIGLSYLVALITHSKTKKN